MVLRNTGEYLSKMIEKIDKNNFLPLMNLGIISGIMAGMSLTRVIQDFFAPYYTIIYIILIVICLYLSIKIFLQIRKIEKESNIEISKYKKGLIGEQEVVYEISLLQGKFTDFYVINDFQLEEGKKGNIDHIIICKKGIFALETKNLSNIINGGHKAQAQARGEALKIRDILKNKFNDINFVRALFIFINIENKPYIEIEERCTPVYYKDLEKYFDSLSSNQNIGNTREIYEYLVGLQQKDG